jgi:hypothetical protein
VNGRNASTSEVDASAATLDAAGGDPTLAMAG